MSAELLRQARAGDQQAFAALVEPHRTELRVHCYRMLGSLQDAEDAVQETLLAAWRGLGGFEERSSVRTWLYRIATNRCRNVVRASASRSPAVVPAGPLPYSGPPPEPTRLGDVSWLQPYPDVLLAGLPDQAPGPEARYESREAISLAFITAVQLLPPNQRAVLLLRDVLGYHASETADLLGLTEDAANSALKRARATMAANRAAATEPGAPGASGGLGAGSSSSSAPTPPSPDGPDERELLDRFVEAFTELDVDALVALMTDDVWVRMPPLPFEYIGTAAAHRWFTAVDAHRRQVERLVPAGANGQPAWGEYIRDPASGGLRFAGVLVVAFTGGGVSEITHFEGDLAAHFGLPETLG
jgi:RNA polymerase sigma-70 factor (TIGR02960 family)